jgi:hypothetical protein
MTMTPEMIPARRVLQGQLLLEPVGRSNGGRENS